MRGVMVHGRFQPFHNEHLEYVLEGLNRSEGLVMVGITNPFPQTHPEGGFSGDSHRHDPAANPYSFIQRARMVQLSLAHEGVAPGEALVIPLHFGMLDHYSTLAGEVEQLVNVLDEWDAEKCNRFADVGFSVTRFHRPRTMSGTQVRQMIDQGESIDHLVPHGTLTVLAGELGQCKSSEAA